MLLIGDINLFSLFEIFDIQQLSTISLSLLLTKVLRKKWKISLESLIDPPFLWIVLTNSVTNSDLVTLETSVNSSDDNWSFYKSCLFFKFNLIISKSKTKVCLALIELESKICL